MLINFYLFHVYNVQIEIMLYNLISFQMIIFKGQLFCFVYESKMIRCIIIHSRVVINFLIDPKLNIFKMIKIYITYSKNLYNQ